MLHFHKPEEFKECASGENNMSGDTRDLDEDVDSTLEKACEYSGSLSFSLNRKRR